MTLTKNMEKIECIDEKCFSWTTYFYWEGKQLKEPIIRCIARKCHLDNQSTKEVNDVLKKTHKIKYLKNDLLKRSDKND